MTALSTDLRSSLADLQTRHADLITAVSGYKDGSLGRAIADVQAANQAVTARLDAEESAILGLAALKSAKPQPSLCLDFVEQKYLKGTRRLEKGYGFKDIITFTRASGGGRFNSQGQYEWLPANEPRIDYDPVTGECRGLLIEESRTNVLTNSGKMSTEAFVPQGCSISDDAGRSLLQESTNTGNHRAYLKNLNALFGNVNTFSADVEPRGRTSFSIEFESVSTGARLGAAAFTLEGEGTISGSSAALATIMKIGQNKWRVSMTSSAAVYYGLVPFIYLRNTPTTASYTGDGVSGIIFENLQYEVGAFPTSYIPTAAAQVTRAADIASVNELSPWYNPEQGTIMAKHTSFKTGNNNSYLWALTASNDATMIRVSHGWGSPTAVLAAVGSSGVVARGNNALPMRTALSWRNGEPALFSSSNGTPVSTTPNPASVPTNPSLNIGNYNRVSLQLNGHIEYIRYFPRALSNIELQRITA